MKNLFTFFSLLFLLVGFTAADAQVQTARYTSMTALSNAYYEYLPQGYSATGSQAYPLIIFVHGLGELGDGSAGQLPLVLDNGTPLQISQGIFPTSFTVGGQTFRFIVLSPQFTAWPASTDIDNIITYATQHYKVDVNRVYLTGLSMGGGVVWEYAGNNSTYAKRVAAMVPICGASWPDAGRADIIAGGDIPVWATHNDNDPTCPVAYTIGYVTNINTAPTPPNPLAKKTIFSSSSHDAWTATYNLNYRENGMNVYEWMLQFSRSNIILPVTGVSLNLQKKNNAVFLTWKTYTEINNKGFIVERSTDGKNYTQVAFVKSNSINGDGAGYSYTDASPLNGKNYYRLVQQDLNGNSRISAVEYINFASTNGIKLFPNPVKDVLNINADHIFSNAQLNIWDLSGHLTRQVLLNGGSANLSVKGLPAGMYNAEIKDGTSEVKLPFVKQ